MTCLDIAHTLHELANEGKLIIGHVLDIMQGTNWDHYTQKNESMQVTTTTKAECYSPARMPTRRSDKTPQP